jgi:hypothetical protein
MPPLLIADDLVVMISDATTLRVIRKWNALFLNCSVCHEQYDWSKKRLLSVFIISLDMYGIGSLASDPWCGFFRSPTSRPINKGEQVRDVTVVYISKVANVILFKLLTQCTWKIKSLALIFRKKDTYRSHVLCSTVLFQKVNYIPIRWILNYIQYN